MGYRKRHMPLDHSILTNCFYLLMIFHTCCKDHSMLVITLCLFLLNYVINHYSILYFDVHFSLILNRGTRPSKKLYVITVKLFFNNILCTSSLNGAVFFLFCFSTGVQNYVKYLTCQNLSCKCEFYLPWRC